MPEKNALIWLWLSSLVVLIDQVTKFAATFYLEYAHPYAVAPFFNLTLLHNKGAAFSFLADAGGWQRWLFTGLAIIISVAIIAWLAKLPRQQRWLAIGLAFILGGAVGNVIDRLLYGYVVDFLDFYYENWHYPAFNIADSAITVGAIMLIIDGFSHKNNESEI